jgi:Rrf2 family protein
VKFNTKTRYGLRTMLELSLNTNPGKGVLQKEIAENQAVSVRYLDQIIASLKAANLIINAGGRKSGYKLKRPSHDITIYDVYLAFDDELSIIDCLRPGEECPRNQSCVLRKFWNNLNDNIKSQMEAVNLKMLAEDYRSSEKALMVDI